MSTHISIYGYTNFRQFLSDFYQTKKAGKRGYSFRQFSQAAGFKSPNILKLVIEGQRNLTPQSIEKFLEALNLSGNQASYFRSLVAMNQAESDEERKEHLESLQRLMPHAKRHQLDTEAAEYLSHWIYPVLRELVQHNDFRDDPYWIQRRLTGRIDIKEIVRALNFLKKNSLISKDAEGRFSVKDDMVISSDEIKSLAVRTYHKCALEQSLAALVDLPIDQREFGALIFQIPDQSLLELKQRLKSFRQELHEWALEQQKKAPDNTVVQLNLQMFPQTKKALT